MSSASLNTNTCTDKQNVLYFVFSGKHVKISLLHMNELKYNGLLIIATGCAVVAGTRTTGALKLSVYASELQLITTKPPPTPSASPMISPHLDQHHSLRAPKAFPFLSVNISFTDTFCFSSSYARRPSGAESHDLCFPLFLTGQNSLAQL